MPTCVEAAVDAAPRPTPAIGGSAQTNNGARARREARRDQAARDGDRAADQTRGERAEGQTSVLDQDHERQRRLREAELRDAPRA